MLATLRKLAKRLEVAVRNAERENSRLALDTRTTLAKRLDVSLRTVDDWREREIIPYLKIGGVVRFEFTQVMAALRERYEVREKSRAAR